MAIAGRGPGIAGNPGPLIDFIAILERLITEAKKS